MYKRKKKKIHHPKSCLNGVFGGASLATKQHHTKLKMLKRAIESVAGIFFFKSHFKSI